LKEEYREAAERWGQFFARVFQTKVDPAGRKLCVWGGQQVGDQGKKRGKTGDAQKGVGSGHNPMRKRVVTPKKKVRGGSLPKFRVKKQKGGS